MPLISFEIFPFLREEKFYSAQHVEIVSYIVTVLSAYLLGSIPTGYIVGKARGIDIRTVGSCNIGATNVFRILGKGAGILVLVVDALKGVVACLLVPWMVLKLFGDGAPDPEWLAIVAAIASILGHNYTCWLKFKGGKGIATTAGVLLALFPKAFVVCLIVFLVVFIASRYVSLASISAAVCLPFAVYFFGGSTRMLGVATLMAALAIYKHKVNIQRLLNGTENRFGKKKEGT